MTQVADVCAAQTALSESKVAALAERRARKGKQPVHDEMPLVNKRSPQCRRVWITVRFNGSQFHGWMRQPGLRTVQEVLEDVIRPLLGQRVRLVPSGRTDAGVHATAQVCQFDALLGDVPVESLVPVLAVQLPGDICVTRAVVVQPSSNIMVTLWKRYVYRIFGDAASINCFCGQVTQSSPGPLRPLNIELMQEAATRLIGTHDFAGFQSRGGRQSTVRTVHRCVVSWRPEGVVVVMEGDGFLMHMCRILAGTLLEIGCARKAPSQVDVILETQNRQESKAVSSATDETDISEPDLDFFEGLDQPEETGGASGSTALVLAGAVSGAMRPPPALLPPPPRKHCPKPKRLRFCTQATSFF